jgi:hypothetical protein
MYRLVSERVAPPFICIGHDGGLNIANGSREYHLATVANLAPGFIHVIPRNSQIAHAAFVRSAVLTPLSLSPVVGDYPPALVVGPSGGATAIVAFRTRARGRRFSWEGGPVPATASSAKKSPTGMALRKAVRARPGAPAVSASVGNVT